MMHPTTKQLTPWVVAFVILAVALVLTGGAWTIVFPLLAYLAVAAYALYVRPARQRAAERISV